MISCSTRLLNNKDYKYYFFLYNSGILIYNQAYKTKWRRGKHVYLKAAIRNCHKQSFTCFQFRSSKTAYNKTKCELKNELIITMDTRLATAHDYLIKTLFKLKHTKQSDPSYARWLLRFNNIVFNNFDEISNQLALDIIKTKISQNFISQLDNIKFATVIIHHRNKNKTQPIIVQYFDRSSGIQHRLIGYQDNETTCSTVVMQHGDLCDKIIGFCGDFSVIDQNVLIPTERFKSLRTILRRNLHYLPHSDDFLKTLFPIISSYLPSDKIQDVYNLLHQIGDLFRRKSEVGLACDLKEKYLECLDSGQDIMLSDFTSMVISKLDAIVSYLIPIKICNMSLDGLQDLQTRFFLIYVHELYVKAAEIFNFEINCAVIYYFQLSKLKELFKTYQGTLFKSPLANKRLNEDIAVLESDPDEASDWIRSRIDMPLDLLLERCVAIVTPLLQHLSVFQDFEWVIFKDLDLDGFHRSYHVMVQKECDNDCNNLEEDVEKLRRLDYYRHGYAPVDRAIDSIWTDILNQDGISFNHVADLVSFVFSLPCSLELLPLHSKDLSSIDSDFDQVGAMLTFNLKRLDEDDFVASLERVEMDEVERIITTNQIRVLED